jgi:hypothetical protein
MASSAEKIIHEIAETIAGKQRLYRTAYASDLDRLRAVHGNAAIDEALAMLNTPAKRQEWDEQGHREAVANLEVHGEPFEKIRFASP